MLFARFFASRILILRQSLMRIRNKKSDDVLGTQPLPPILAIRVRTVLREVCR